MNAKIYCSIVTATILLSGCLLSLNPVYTDRDLVFDPDVVGVWKQPQSAASWEFTKRDEKSYVLVYTDENGHLGRFIARLARINGTLFLDLYPQEVQGEANSFYKAHLVPIHTVYLVRRTTPNVVLGAIDMAWLDKYLAENPGALAHARLNDHNLITASTAELQAFLLQHKDAFKGEVSLERKTVATK